METALIPTCANTYGRRGHVWRELIGGRRCDVCGKQEAVPNFTPMEIRFAEHYALRITTPRYYIRIIETASA